MGFAYCFLRARCVILLQYINPSNNYITYYVMPIYFSFFPTGPFIIVFLGGSIMNCMEFVTIAIGAHVHSIRQAVIYFLFSFTRREGNTMAWFLFYFVRTVQAIIYIFIQRELYHNVQALKTDYSSCTGSSSYTAQRSWMNYNYNIHCVYATGFCFSCIQNEWVFDSLLLYYRIHI